MDWHYNNPQPKFPEITLFANSDAKIIQANEILK